MFVIVVSGGVVSAGVGVRVGVRVAVRVAVRVGVAVAVRVGVAVAVRVAVAVGVCVCVAVRVAVCVGVEVSVGVRVAVALAEGTGVLVSVAVRVGVAVGVGVPVAVAGGAVRVGVAVAGGVAPASGVCVMVGVGVTVGVPVGIVTALAVAVTVASSTKPATINDIYTDDAYVPGAVVFKPVSPDHAIRVAGEATAPASAGAVAEKWAAATVVTPQISAKAKMTRRPRHSFIAISSGRCISKVTGGETAVHEGSSHAGDRDHAKLLSHLST